VLLLLVLATPAAAQVQSRPTDPPLVTAENESWYRLGEPVQFAGDLYYRAGRAEDARDAFQRAVKLAPRLGDDVYFKLGNLALKLGQQAEAVRCWREALVLNPAHETARRNLATLDPAAVRA